MNTQKKHLRTFTPATWLQIQVGADNLERIGQEGDENVRIDAPIQLAVNRANAQVTLEFFERLFDFGELDVPGPELNGIVAGKIGAQQIAAFTAADLA